MVRSRIDEINARVVGRQESTLIFVHGFACALDDWDRQVEALSPRFRCVALDLPGHGRSPRPETASIAVMGGAVNSVRERIGARSAILVGHSMGCRVIIEALQQSRAKLAGLVFVEGSILDGDPETTIKRSKDAIDSEGMDAFTQRFFGDMFLEGSDTKLRERLIARAQGVDAKSREALLLDMIRWDLTTARDALRQITVPTLVLQSTYINSELKRIPMQPGMTTPWMDAVASLVPTSEAKIFHGVGHFAMIEGAQPVNDAIEKFATRLD
jgi:pimeloyl-ACP methyl ester carboxylesterase